MLAYANFVEVLKSNEAVQEVGKSIDNNKSDDHEGAKINFFVMGFSHDGGHNEAGNKIRKEEHAQSKKRVP